MPELLLSQFNSYEDARQAFRWDIPRQYNIAVDVCDRHAGSGRPAAINVGPSHSEVLTFDLLSAASNRLASALVDLGVKPGNHVVTLIGNKPDSLVVTLAILKAGAVLVQLPLGASAETYDYQIQTVDPAAAFCSPEFLPVLAPLLDKHHVRPIVSSGDWRKPESLDSQSRFSVASLVREGSEQFTAIGTAADDPAYVNFTSGSTGKPKGVVLPHRFVLGVLPSLQAVSDLGPRPDDVFFAALGWSHLGGLRTVTFPAWHYGRPVVAIDRPNMTGRDFYQILSEHRVSVAHIMPWLLKLMREVETPAQEFDMSALRVIYCGGEPIGERLQEWFQHNLGVVIHTYYGSSEVAMVSSACSAWFPNRLGTIGKPVPGHDLQLLDEFSHQPVAAGVPGMIAIHKDDPCLSTGYLQKDGPPVNTLTGDYFLLGDIGQFDADGYLHFVGRVGEVIYTTENTIVGPAMIEDPALAHPAIQDAAAVQVAEHGSRVVKLCLVAKPGHDLDKLRDELNERLREALPSSVFPVEVVFLSDLPRTAGTNKVQHSKVREMFGKGAAVKS